MGIPSVGVEGADGVVLVAPVSRLPATNTSQALTTKAKIPETIRTREGVAATAKNARNPRQMGTSRTSAQYWEPEVMRTSGSGHRAHFAKLTIPSKRRGENMSS